jgi:hypothetical protein
MRITTDYPSIPNYAAAEQRWNEVKPWRGEIGEWDERPLSNHRWQRRKHHMSIRKLTDGSYVCKLYYTDCVTYRPDGVILVQSYPSSSTSAFIRALLPRVDCSFAGEPMVLWLHGMTHGNVQGIRADGGAIPLVYQPGDRYELAPGFKPTPFQRPQVNRVKARAALKQYGLQDFSIWLTARNALRDDIEGNNGFGDGPHYGRTRVIHLLRDKGLEAYEEVAAFFMPSPWRRNRTKAALTQMRHEIYRMEECVDITPVTHLSDYAEYRPLRAALSKYDFAT